MRKSKSNLVALFLLLICTGELSISERLCAQEIKKFNDAEMNLTFRQIIDKYYPHENFYFGAISNGNFLKKGNKDVDFYNKEFSYNTPENEFKQPSVYPQPDSEWRSDIYLGLIDLARKNNQLMRAHAPISPQCSKWVMEDNRTSEELRPLLIKYVTTISKTLEANKDVVKWMDVVNETVVTNNINDSLYQYKTGDWFGPLMGSTRWQNPWTILGYELDSDFKIPTYIKLAFQIANKYAPDIKLLYNHHGKLETQAFDKVKQTVLYLRSQGIRVDAIGWQAHINVGFENDPDNLLKLRSLIDWCYRNNLEFHVTELDVNVGKNVSKTKIKDMENEIADTYAAILDTFMKKIGKGAVGFNCWAIHDRYRVVEGTFAGILDDDSKPRLAFYKMKRVMLMNARSFKK